MQSFLCLSLVKPAGDSILSGRKRLEIRKWLPDTVPLFDLLLVQNNLRLSSKGPSEDPAGTALALVDVISAKYWAESDVTAAGSDAWQPGYFAWEIGNVRALSYPESLPARRRLYRLELDEKRLRIAD
jgi:hypothetical protein